MLLRKLWSLLDHKMDTSLCGCVVPHKRVSSGSFVFPKLVYLGEFTTRGKFVAWLPLAQSTFKDHAANILASSPLISVVGN